jgi:hypothetical protein
MARASLTADRNAAAVVAPRGRGGATAADAPDGSDSEAMTSSETTARSVEEDMAFIVLYVLVDLSCGYV